MNVQNVHLRTGGASTAAYVQPALQVTSADDVTWDDSADVLVVGFGGAGVSAALQAREQGADVLALERFEGGGATALCGGIYYGGATRHLREAGFEDTPEAMYRYLKLEIGDAVRDETLRRFCDQSNPNLEWLESHGVRFGSKAYVGKRSYPPAGHDLYFSGNERWGGHVDAPAPAPRGHKVVGPNFTGSVLFEHLRGAAMAKGVRLRRHCRVERLIVDAQGRVIGLEATQLPEDSEPRKRHRTLIRRVNAFLRFSEKQSLKTAERIERLEDQGVRVRIRAHRGVILSTGSFAFNREMVGRHAPAYAQAMPLGTLGCDGSGVALGQSVGADVSHMHMVSAWRSIVPPSSFLEGMVVNRQGQRFISEDIYLGHMGMHIAERQGGKAWVVVDRDMFRRAFRETLPSRGNSWFNFGMPLLINLLFNRRKGATIAELAGRCGIDPAGLQRTLNDYNEAARRGEDPLHKHRDYRRPLGEGPYYGIDISIANAKFPCPSIPMGGLRVDEDSGQVLRGDGSPIAGLYAAGRAAAGIPSGFYISGISVADCVFSGRRAARAVVANGAQAAQDADGYRLLVLSNAVAGEDEAFNRWYDEQHLHDVLTVPGISAAQRFAIDPLQPGEDSAWRYAAIYQMGADPQASLAAMNARIGGPDMPLSPAFDLASVQIRLLRPLGTKRQQNNNQPPEKRP
jgi:3-oxo-5alpha-steroid 4-dehydrogenase